MFSCQMASYPKAFAIMRKRIELAESNVSVAGREYLEQVRYATFISLKYGQDSLAYQKALKSCKKALGRYMKALEFCYDSIHFDLKEIMD